MTKRKIQSKKQKVATSGHSKSKKEQYAEKQKAKLVESTLKALVAPVAPGEEPIAEPELDNNGGEPPPANVNEDAQKDEAMMTTAEMMGDGLAPTQQGKIEPTPAFDAKDFVARFLIKKDGE